MQANRQRLACFSFVAAIYSACCYATTPTISASSTRTSPWSPHRTLTFVQPCARSLRSRRLPASYHCGLTSLRRRGLVVGVCVRVLQAASSLAVRSMAVRQGGDSLVMECFSIAVAKPRMVPKWSARIPRPDLPCRHTGRPWEDIRVKCWRILHHKLAKTFLLSPSLSRNQTAEGPGTRRNAARIISSPLLSECARPMLPELLCVSFTSRLAAPPSPLPCHPLAPQPRPTDGALRQP